MKSLFFAIFFAFVVTIGSVQAYKFLSVFQDDGSSDNVVEAPSFFWDGVCEVDINLLATASHTGAFSLSNEWFSPDDTLIATSTPVYPNDITCLSQGIPTEDTSLNDFYESKTETLSTATSTDTWIRAIYNCTPDDNLNILYSNTAVLDSHDHFPYGYILNTGSYCQVGSPGGLPNLQTRLNIIIDYIATRYDTECSSQDLVIAEIGGASITCAQNRFFGNTFWYIVPFNSGSAGIVNISVLEQGEVESGDCAMNCVTNTTFIYDTVLNSTTSLGSSTPLTQNLVLQRDRDYWLFIGTQCNGGVGGAGTCTLGYNHSEYNISIFAYEPIFECGDWSECESGIQTRICVDVNGLVPDLIETRSCFDTPTFDLTLGFEEFNLIQDGVYLCQKQFWLLICPLSLQTIDALYPVNWTIISELDNAGVERNNFVKVSAETASVGSRSLKMWYIPPKLEEPVNDGAGSTVCGNASSGSFPEVQHDYNESLFISQNVTFDNPFAQIRYDVRKCNEPVLQYDLTQFGCGELCYASSCNDTPSGRYGVRVSRLEEQEIISFPSFSFFDDTGNNETENVTDGDIDTFADFSSNVPGATVNSTENIFFNGTFLNFTLNVTGGAVDLCIMDGATELTRVNVLAAATLFEFTLTLGNLSAPTNEINIEQCAPPARTVQMRLFLIRNEVMDMEGEIVFDYVGFAPTTWDAGQIIHDLSNINLETGINYSISVAVNPENQFDPLTHCVYMDNFRVTFTEIALPECISECISGSIDRRIASLSNGVCTFITQTNSPDCIADEEERTEVENILAGLGGGDISDNSTCIDSDNDGISDDLYIFDIAIGSSEIVIDSAACLIQVAEEERADELTSPMTGTSQFLEVFGFLMSPLFIYFIISFVLSGILAGGIVGVTKSANGVFEIFGVTMTIMILIGSLPAIGIIPIWISIAIISVISLLIAQKLRNLGFGSGGG